MLSPQGLSNKKPPLLSEAESGGSMSLEDMQAMGFRVILSENIQERFAILDKEIVWYGSLDFLGKEDAEDNLMRIQSKEAAEELLAIAVSRNITQR